MCLIASVQRAYEETRRQWTEIEASEHEYLSGRVTRVELLCEGARIDWVGVENPE